MKKILLIITFLFISLAVFTTRAFAVEGIWTNPKGIKVYIPQNNLAVTMSHAFEEWQRKTNGYFTFQFVNTKSTAQIEVKFMESGIPEICKVKGALGCTRTATVENHMGKRIKHAIVYISSKSNNGKLMTHTEIYTIMLHEVGHALGMGHTKDPKSIMHAGTNQSMAVKQEIQTSDLNLLYDLYHPKKD
jgi:predicted Zn-dependent protease